MTLTLYDLLVLLAPVAGATWWVSVLYHRLCARLDRLEGELGSVARGLSGVRQATGALIGRLGRRTSDKGNPVAWDGLSAEEVAQLLATMHDAAAAEALAELRPAGNPISSEELDRLRAFHARTSEGDLLSYEEAHEFYELARKVADDPAYRRISGRNSLLGIASFLLGYWQGVRGPEDTHEHTPTA